MKKMLCALCMAVLLFCNSFAEETPDLPSMLQEARNGDIESMCDLGLVYFHGKGTLKDPFKAKSGSKKPMIKDQAGRKSFGTILHCGNIRENVKTLLMISRNLSGF